MKGPTEKHSIRMVPENDEASGASVRGAPAGSLFLLPCTGGRDYRYLDLTGVYLLIMAVSSFDRKSLQLETVTIILRFILGEENFAGIFKDSFNSEF